MIGRGIGIYIGKVRLLSRNARLYLLYLMLSGVPFGVYALLYNFYVLGLGYDEALLGRLLTVNTTAALIGALPAGFASDRLGRKISLLISGLVTAVAVAGMVIWSSMPGLVIMNVLLGLAQSLGAVTLAPFLMENSGDEELTYLFSFSFSLQMIIGMLGFWLGGRLPAWLADETAGILHHEDPYGLVMLVIAGTAVLALVPLLFLRSPAHKFLTKVSHPSALHYARQHPAALIKFTLPVLITALGAGLFVPFMNVFYRTRYGLSDAAIGSLFAMGSLAMGVGFLAAAPLADRYGKIKLVILTQVLFIPSLVLLGFSPWFWLSGAAYLVRVVLMTMDDPIFEAFVMEHIEDYARATVASLLTIASRLGWALGPTISGSVQVAYGFGPVFLGALLAYVVAIFVTWRFFLWKKGATAERSSVTSAP
jgi:MFS family permease